MLPVTLRVIWSFICLVGVIYHGKVRSKVSRLTGIQKQKLLPVEQVHGERILSMAAKVDEVCSRTETFSCLGFPCCQIKVYFSQSFMPMLMHSDILMLNKNMCRNLPSTASLMVMGEWQQRQITKSS